MEYKKQSLDLLKNLYPNVNFYAIRRAFQYESPSYNFTAAYHKLTSIDSGEEPNYLSTLKNIRVKNPRKAKSFQTTDPILLQEIDAIPALNQKENAPPQANQAPPPPPPPDVVVSPEVTWECSCCFGDDFASGEMGHCGDGTHFFCIDCLEQYAQTQVEADGSLNCFCDDECTSIIPKCFRDKLPSALTDNLDDRAFRASVLKAGLEGIWYVPSFIHVCFKLLSYSCLVASVNAQSVPTSLSWTHVSPTPLASLAPSAGQSSVLLARTSRIPRRRARKRSKRSLRAMHAPRPRRP